MIREKIEEYVESHEFDKLFDFSEARFARIAIDRVGHEEHEKGWITGIYCQDHGRTSGSLWILQLSPAGYNNPYPCDECDAGGLWSIDNLKRRFIAAYGKEPESLNAIETMTNFGHNLRKSRVKELFGEIDLYADFEYAGGGRRSTISLADIRPVGMCDKRGRTVVDIRQTRALDHWTLSTHFTRGITPSRSGT